MAHDQLRRRDGAVDAELAEQRLVLRVVDAGNGAVDVEARFGNLTEGKVVLVLSGNRDHEVGALHAGAFHGGGVAGVALHDDVGAQVFAYELDAGRILLDNKDFMVGDEGTGEVVANFTAASDDDEHARAPLARSIRGATALRFSWG